VGSRPGVALSSQASEVTSHFCRRRTSWHQQALVAEEEEKVSEALHQGMHGEAEVGSRLGVVFSSQALEAEVPFHCCRQRTSSHQQVLGAEGKVWEVSRQEQSGLQVAGEVGSRLGVALSSQASEGSEVLFRFCRRKTSYRQASGAEEKVWEFLHQERFGLQGVAAEVGSPLGVALLSRVLEGSGVEEEPFHPCRQRTS
jgi:hypothetical protein